MFLLTNAGTQSMKMASFIETRVLDWLIVCSLSRNLHLILRFSCRQFWTCALSPSDRSTSKGSCKVTVLDSTAMVPNVPKPKSIISGTFINGEPWHCACLQFWCSSYFLYSLRESFLSCNNAHQSFSVGLRLDPAFPVRTSVWESSSKSGYHLFSLMFHPSLWTAVKLTLVLPHSFSSLACLINLWVAVSHYRPSSARVMVAVVDDRKVAAFMDETSMATANDSSTVTDIAFSCPIVVLSKEICFGRSGCKDVNLVVIIFVSFVIT